MIERVESQLDWHDRGDRIQDRSRITLELRVFGYPDFALLPLAIVSVSADTSSPLEQHRDYRQYPLDWKVDEGIGTAREVEARCAIAHREGLVLAAWAAALVTVLVCLGQLAAERAPPSRSERFKNLEVD